MRTAPVIIGLVAAVALVAGGTSWYVFRSHAAAAQDSNGPTGATVGSHHVTPNIADLLSRVGCHGGVDKQPQTYAAQSGRCTLPAGDVLIATFDGIQPMQSWIAAAKQARDSGLGLAVLISGDSWAAGASTQRAADRIIAALGGTIVA